jgi:hypothetical protein
VRAIALFVQPKLVSVKSRTPKSYARLVPRGAHANLLVAIDPSVLTVYRDEFDTDALRAWLVARLKPHRGTRWYSNWQWGVMVATDRYKQLIPGQTHDHLALRHLDEPRWTALSHDQWIEASMWPAPRALARSAMFDAALCGDMWIDRADFATQAAFEAALTNAIGPDLTVAAVVVDDQAVPGAI